MANYGDGSRRKDDEIRPRILELRRRWEAGEPLFQDGERFEIGGRDESDPETVYRPTAGTPRLC